MRRLHVYWQDKILDLYSINKGIYGIMISEEAKKIKDVLFRNQNLEYLLNTPQEVQRKDWEDSALDFILPEGIKIIREKDINISADWISSETSDKQEIILYFHGGGLTQGSSITHRKLASHIVRVVNVPVIIHDYPLAPENPYPAALVYSQKVYLWLLKKGYKNENIIFGGDSSGGGLALALIMKLKNEDHALPKAGVFLSPMLDFTLSGNTMKKSAKLDPLVFEDDLKMSVKYYCRDESPYNPYISPIFGKFNGVPPLLIQVGRDEILLDDSKRLYDKAKLSGVNVQLDIWDDMWHVFQGWVEEIPEAELSLRKIKEWKDNIFPYIKFV
jgi:acetyl esterase/lipase